MEQINLKLGLQLLVIFSLFGMLIAIIDLVHIQAQPAKSKPQVNVTLHCQVASTLIPGEFNASGFSPKSHVGILMLKPDKNDASASASSPFKGLHNDMTDSLGNVNGSFNIDVKAGPYQNYTLRIFLDANRDDSPDSNLEQALSPIKC